MLVNVDGKLYDVLNAQDFPDRFPEVRKLKEKKEREKLEKLNSRKNNNITSIRIELPEDIKIKFQKECKNRNISMTVALLDYIKKFNKGYKRISTIQ